jgi:PAS domain S-box-containing protein
MPSSTDPVLVLYVGPDAHEEGAVPDRLAATADAVEVTGVTDPATAREYLADQPADCVVVRQDLAEGSGVDFVASIRSADADLPVVLFPRDGSEDIASAAISAGVTEYLADGSGDRMSDLAAVVREIVDGTVAGDTDDGSVDWPADATAAGPGGTTDVYDDEVGFDSGPVTQLDPSAQLNLLEQIFRQVPVSLYVKDTEGRHLLMSDSDQSPVDAVGKTDPEIYDADLARESYRDDMHVVETGDPIYNKEEYNPAEDQWVLTSKVPWYDDGEIMGLIGVTRLITEKKEYEREIERKNERLERFASVVSHDLRNPLNVAQARLALLREDGVDNEHAENLGTALDRMEALIDDVLELARKGHTIDETDPVTLSAVFTNAWSTVETGGASYEITGDCQFEADPSRLTELFGNLVRNAVEHGSTSPRSGDHADAVEHASGEGTGRADGAALTVRVGALEDGFFFADDGPGIPDAEKDGVFEVGHTTAADGTGFGLSIVEEIADAHGWSVAVTDAETGGARFEVTGIDSVTPVERE